MRKDGTLGFSHPYGTHDDVWWSIALAVYATVEMEPEPFLAVIPGEQKSDISQALYLELHISENKISAE